MGRKRNSRVSPPSFIDMAGCCVDECPRRGLHPLQEAFQGLAGFAVASVDCFDFALSLTYSLRGPDLGWSRPAERKGDTQKAHRRNFGGQAAERADAVWAGMLGGILASKAGDSSGGRLDGEDAFGEARVTASRRQSGKEGR